MLNLVVDNSGSMIEGGRRFVERTVVRQLGRFLRTGAVKSEVRLYLLSGNLVETSWSPDVDVPPAILSPSGRLNVEALLSAPFLPSAKTVFITDFCFGTEDERKIRDLITQKHSGRVFVVRIGEGASSDRVDDGVFTVERIEGLVRELQL